MTSSSSTPASLDSDSDGKIGVFDSGLGGLTVVRHIRDLLPDADLVYIGDRQRAPYGPRPRAEVQAFSRQITRRLIELGCSIVVIACNTASAAALHEMRTEFPDITFVGMEPAVKPATHATETGVVGVLATDGTLDGPLYESVVQRFGSGALVLGEAAPEWVEYVERGETTGPALREAIGRHLEPLLDAGADRIVLGCTHFPVLRPAIDDWLRGRAEVIDPGPAVARQTRRVAELRGSVDGSGALVLELTGSRDGLEAVLTAIGLASPTGVVVSELT